MPVFDQRGYTGQPLYTNRNVFLWSYFPAIARSSGHGKFAGKLYRAVLEEHKRKYKKGGKLKHPVTLSRAERMSLMQEVERRIVQMDMDDQFLVLAG